MQVANAVEIDPTWLAQESSDPSLNCLVAALRILVRDFVFCLRERRRTQFNPGPICQVPGSQAVLGTSIASLNASFTNKIEA
jgi:hypothetical protein